MARAKLLHHRVPEDPFDTARAARVPRVADAASASLLAGLAEDHRCARSRGGAAGLLGGGASRRNDHPPERPGPPRASMRPECP